MSVVSLNHYNVRTADLEGMRRFYEEAVGLRAGPRPPFDFPGLWLYSEDQVAVLHLVGVAEGQRAAGTGSLDHIAFICQGFPEARARLERLGVPFREAMVPASGLRQLFVTDPEGIKIEMNFPPEGRDK
jgi:catechol 2,3-dioxygenase-like lactoylglutathione lyase family enzyme